MLAGLDHAVRLGRLGHAAAPGRRPAARSPASTHGQTRSRTAATIAAFSGRRPGPQRGRGDLARLPAACRGPARPCAALQADDEPAARSAPAPRRCGPGTSAPMLSRITSTPRRRSPPGPGRRSPRSGSRSRRPRRARGSAPAWPRCRRCTGPGRRAALATWMACVPMPDAPPCTRNVSPSRRWASWPTFDQTVQATSGSAGGLQQGQPGRHRQQLAGRDRDPLRVPAAAEQRAHLVADGPAGHAVAERGDPARALQPRVRRGARRRRVVALPLQEVGPVDRAGGDLDEHLAGAGLRVRHLGPLQHLGTAGLADRDRVHGPSLGGRRTA